MRDLDLKSIGKWLVYSVLIGVVAGLGSTLFYYLLQLSGEFFLNYLGGYYPPLPGGESTGSVRSASVSPHWIIGLIPTLGGLIAGVK